MKGLLAFNGVRSGTAAAQAKRKALFIYVSLAQLQRLEVGFLQFRRQEFFDGGFQRVHAKGQHARRTDHAQEHGVAALYGTGLHAKFAAGHKVALSGDLTGLFHNVRHVGVHCLAQ